MMSKYHYTPETSFSPLPVLMTLLFSTTFMSIMMFMKEKSTMIFMNLILMSYLMISWWKEYSTEINQKGFQSFLLEKTIKMGMMMFITSEIMFFVSLFWAYFHFALYPTFELGTTWPPSKMIFFQWNSIPTLNTLLLLSSSVTVTASHYLLTMSKMKMSMIYLKATIMLGILFSILQKKEYSSSFFSINDSNFGSAFFMLTGFHGIHVMIGTIFLMKTNKKWVKSLSQKPGSMLSMELSCWYWHFVDTVWIFVFSMLYLKN